VIGFVGATKNMHLLCGDPGQIVCVDSKNRFNLPDLDEEIEFLQECQALAK